MTANRHAVALGRLSKGHPKTISAERKCQLIRAVKVARENRWVVCDMCGVSLSPKMLDKHECDGMLNED